MICSKSEPYKLNLIEDITFALNGFCLHYFPIVIPYLLENVVTYFNILMKREVIVWGNVNLFSWRDKIWFFCSRWKYLICFLF